MQHYSWLRATDSELCVVVQTLCPSYSGGREEGDHSSQAFQTSLGNTNRHTEVSYLGLFWILEFQVMEAQLI